MSRPELTKEKITELLEKSHERSFQRYREEYHQEILVRFRAEQEKSIEKETKEQIETVPS